MTMTTDNVELPYAVEDSLDDISEQGFSSTAHTLRAAFTQQAEALAASAAEVAELRAALREISCCDDVNLGVPLARAALLAARDGGVK